MNNTIKIVCLPVAGIADPTQFLMIKGLNDNPHIDAMNGIHDKFFGIIRSAIKYKPDFLHFDWIESYYWRRNLIFTFLNFPMFFIQILLCKYLFKIQIVWTIHNLLPHNRKYQKVKLRILQWFANNVNYIRVLSPESIAQVTNLYKVSQTKIQCIRLGDYTQYYPNTIKRKQARESLHISENALVLMTVGSIKQYKGIPAYLKIINSLNIPNIRIYIVGNCVDQLLENEIKSCMTPKTTFINAFIKNEDLQIYYNAADIIILPFLEIENSGSAVMAMGFKKMLIAPQSNILNDRLKFQSEFLYASGTIDKAIQAACKLNSDEREQIGNKNYIQLQQYHWADFGNIFLEIKKKAIGKNQA